MTKMTCISLVFVLSLCACMKRQAQWAPAGSQEALSTDEITVDWPQGWMTLRPGESDEAAADEGLLLMATRDGFELQTIRLSKRPISAELKHTHKKLMGDMPPREAADVVLDSIRANPKVVELKILDNSPATLAGSQAFRLNVTYRSKSGLLRQSVHYGCINKGRFVMLSFDAPKRHYFLRILPRSRQ